MEGHTNKKLIIGGLVVHENQIRPLAFFPERLNVDMVPESHKGTEKQVNHLHNDPVPKFDPFLFLFHKLPLLGKFAAEAKTIPL